jgi:hypothetical protein
MNEKGAPTPVALTRLRAPESVMGPSADALISSTVAGSALLPKYGAAVDNVSAYEKISGKAAADSSAAAPARDGGTSDVGMSSVDAEARRIEEDILGRPSSRPAPAPASQDTRQEPQRRAPRQSPRQPADDRGTAGDLAGALGGALGGGLKSMARSLGTQLGRELLRGVFGTAPKRRR